MEAVLWVRMPACERGQSAALTRCSFNCGEPFSQCGISKYRSFGNTATVRRGILNVYCDTLCRDTTPFPPRTHTDIPTNNSDTGHNLHPLTYYLRNPALKSGRTPHTTSSEPKSFTSNSHPPARRRLGTASGVTSGMSTPIIPDLLEFGAHPYSPLAALLFCVL